MEMLITPPKDMEEDANVDVDGYEEDADADEDAEDDLDSAIPHSKQEWVIVLGEMTHAEKKAIYGTLKPLLDANQVRQLICVGFHQERDTRMNCDEWFFESDGTRRYPKVQYQSLRAMELSSSFLKDLLPKLNFATSQRLVQTSLFWAGAFRVENPDKKRRWPKAFYSPDAWCSLHPNETYGAIHATTDWLLYEPAGAMHIMVKPSNS
jgi:hypothetical protein